MSLKFLDGKATHECLTVTAESKVQFKKPKKRIHKSILKTDDLLPYVSDDCKKDFSSRKIRHRQAIDPEEFEFAVDKAPTASILSNDKVDTIVFDQFKVVIGENRALNKAKKLRQRKIMPTAPEKVIEILNSIEDSDETSLENKSDAIEMNSVAEFCHTLKEIPTTDASRNRYKSEDSMIIEHKRNESSNQVLEAQNQGAYTEVDIEEKPAEISIKNSEPILFEEPDVSVGLTGALRLAAMRGYLDKEDEISSAPKYTQAYMIEKKSFEDHKFGMKDQLTGHVLDFKEKSNYKPVVNLRYIDDEGRELTTKEAFKYLSRKFHGTNSGKNKIDKKIKKKRVRTSQR